MIDIYQLGNTIITCGNFNQQYQAGGQLAANHFQRLHQKVIAFQKVLEDLKSATELQNFSLSIDFESIRKTIEACNELIQNHLVWQQENRSYLVAGYIDGVKSKASYLASIIKDYKKDIQICIYAHQIQQQDIIFQKATVKNRDIQKITQSIEALAYVLFQRSNSVDESSLQTDSLTTRRGSHRELVHQVAIIKDMLLELENSQEPYWNSHHPVMLGLQQDLRDVFRQVARQKQYNALELPEDRSARDQALEEDSLHGELLPRFAQWSLGEASISANNENPARNDSGIEIDDFSLLESTNGINQLTPVLDPQPLIEHTIKELQIIFSYLGHRVKVACDATAILYRNGIVSINFTSKDTMWNSSHLPQILFLAESKRPEPFVRRDGEGFRVGFNSEGCVHFPVAIENEEYFLKSSENARRFQQFIFNHQLAKSTRIESIKTYQGREGSLSFFQLWRIVDPYTLFTNSDASLIAGNPNRSEYFFLFFNDTEAQKHVKIPLVDCIWRKSTNSPFKLGGQYITIDLKKESDFAKRKWLKIQFLESYSINGESVMNQARRSVSNMTECKGIVVLRMHLRMGSEIIQNRLANAYLDPHHLVTQLIKLK